MLALYWSSLAVLLAGLLPVGPAGIRAQDSTVVCLSSFGWMNNSKSQDPCVVASYLMAKCNGPILFTPLSVGSYYIGPNADDQNTCMCSSVTYSMVSACGLCQNTSIISWNSWASNCANSWTEVFSPGIPDGTAVPHWAYQNVTSSPTFDYALAQSVGDKPESTASVAPSTTTVVSTSTAPLPISTSPLILPAGSSSHNTNVGAIAGGAVGGVVGVALIAAVVVFLIVRKRRSQIPPSAQVAGHPLPSNGYAPQPVSPISPYSPQMTQLKLYDPSDPSTYPSSQPATTTMSGSTANVRTSFVTHSWNIPSSRPGTGGAYTGVPEV